MAAYLAPVAEGWHSCGQAARSASDAAAWHTGPRQATLPRYYNRQPAQSADSAEPVEPQLHCCLAECGVERRYYLYSDRGRLAVSGRGHRSVQPPRGGMVDAD